MSIDHPLSTRERIFEAASDLFYRLGYQAVGVDRIAEESQVAKMTLYRHYPSKDDLIAEHLTRSAEDFWSWFEEAASQSDDPKGKLLAVFSALEEQCRSARCAGCTFQSVAAEFPDRDHPANTIAREHKEAIRRRMESLTEEAGISNPRSTANQLMLLMEGAWASTRLLSLPNPARELRAAVTVILEAS